MYSSETKTLLDKNSFKSRTFGTATIPTQNGHTGSACIPSVQHLPVAGSSSSTLDENWNSEGETSSGIGSSDSKLLSMTWANINVYADGKNGKRKNWLRRIVDRCRKEDHTQQDYERIPEGKHILQNVTGCASPGKLLAILGASGSGKTTLLNVLNQRNLDGLKVTGRVKVNGLELGSKINTISAYIQQSDLFIEVMTPKEHLIFHAELTLGQEVSSARKKARVEEVIVELGLQKCSDTRIGLPGQITGLSGGERKRLSFASKILTSPSLLFCDEPTSGLDSFMAETVVGCLRFQADQRRTVICTIHQPSSQVYSMFDSVMFMADGRVAYLGSRLDADEIFSKAGLQCPSHYNPADYYVHGMAVAPGHEGQSRGKISIVCKIYEASAQRAELDKSLTLTDVTSDTDLLSKVDLLSETKNPYKASRLTQLHYVLWRSWLTVSRDPTLTKTRIIQTLISSLLFGMIYWQQKYDQKGVMNINGMLYLCITQMTFGSMMLVINTFPAEYPLFHRDHHDNIYTTLVYTLSKMIAEVPMFVGVPVIFTVTIYFMIGFYLSIEAFMIHLLVNVLVGNISVSYGYLLSSLTTNVNIILTVSPIFTTVLLTFGGLFVNASTIPPYLMWLKYISWFSYGYEILIVNQWKNVQHIDCESDHMNRSTEVYFNNSSTSSQVITSGKCFRNGEEVIESFGYKGNNMLFDFLMMLALLVGFRLVSFLVLYIRSRRRQI